MAVTLREVSAAAREKSAVPQDPEGFRDYLWQDGRQVTQGVIEHGGIEAPVREGHSGGVHSLKADAVRGACGGGEAAVVQIDGGDAPGGLRRRQGEVRCAAGDLQHVQPREMG